MKEIGAGADLPVLPEPVWPARTTVASAERPLPTPGSDTRPSSGQLTARQPRVVLTGTIRREPIFRRTRRGTLLGKLRVAERVKGRPVWHTVYTLGQRAAEWQRQHLAKGDRIRVRGYQQQRYYLDRDGKRQPTQKIFAVAAEVFHRPSRRHQAVRPHRTEQQASFDQSRQPARERSVLRYEPVLPATAPAILALTEGQELPLLSLSQPAAPLIRLPTMPLPEAVPLKQALPALPRTT